MAVSEIVCGPGGVSGVTYAQINGQQVSCGTDSTGATLYLQVSTLTSDQPVDGGIQAGFQIGAAVLSVMAVAFCYRAVMRFFSGPDGEV